MSSLLWALARGPAALGHGEDTVTVTGGAHGIGGAIAVAWSELVSLRTLYVADAASLIDEAEGIVSLAYSKLPASSSSMRTGNQRHVSSCDIEPGQSLPEYMHKSDVLINCVSMSSPTAISDLGLRSRGVLPGMHERRTGILVNVVVAEKGPAWDAAEAALQKLTDALRSEVGDDPVRIVQALVRLAPGHAHAAAAPLPLLWPAKGESPPDGATEKERDDFFAALRVADQARRDGSAARTVALWGDAARSIVNRVICGRHNIAIDSDAPAEDEAVAAAAAAAHGGGDGHAAATGGAGAAVASPA